MTNRQLRVCYFGTYRANYSRNRIMIDGLRHNGVDVVECRQQLWHGIEDRVQTARGGWWRPSFFARVLRAYWRLFRAWRTVKDYDVMVLGYPGQLDVFLARLLTWQQGKPLVLDVFMSLYLIASERGLTARHPVTGRMIYWLERLAYMLPDLLVLDTLAYVEWFQEVFKLDRSRFRLVPTGADDRVFHPLENVGRDDGVFRVLYYGSFIPNHGVEHIIEAARMAQSEQDIHFELIGDGPAKAHAEALAKQYDLRNVTFIDWLDQQALVRKVAETDLMLGVFGTTPQSMMTVQNKIYEGLAMARCLITGESPTVRQTLTHGRHVWLCQRANPEALVDAILALRTDARLRKSIGEAGYQLFAAQFTVAALGRRFAGHLLELVEGRKN